MSMSHRTMALAHQLRVSEVLTFLILQSDRPAESCDPRILTEIIPNAGHDLSMGRVRGARPTPPPFVYPALDVCVCCFAVCPTGFRSGSLDSIVIWRVWRFDSGTGTVTSSTPLLNWAFAWSALAPSGR